MTLSEELAWRGFVGQTTYEDLTVLDPPGITFYLGVDPSADSMTIGHLAGAIMILHFIKAGHKAILLAGGATGMAGGDPDGKDEARAKLSEEIIQKNVAGIEKQFRQIFAGEDIKIVNNYDWFKEIKFIDFLRDIGWHFSMTQLLDRDFVQSRIGEGGKGLNYAEISYSLIQGYDFLHLFREYGATLQLCGVDQFGNSVSGMQMIRKLEGARADVFGMPLVINKSTGKKFGKSEDGAVWLDPAKTSPYKFYQFWLNSDDAGVIDYLKLYTFLTKAEIDQIAAEHFANPGARAAQKKLAYEVTALVHGSETTHRVMEVTAALFGGSNQTSIGELLHDDQKLAILAREIPIVDLAPTTNTVKGEEFKSEMVSEILVKGAIAASRGEARRLIEQNAISVNGERINSDHMLTEKALIKKGKNQFVLVV